MALTPIKGTIINLEDVFLSTEDGERYVTDRFSLWRLTDLHGRSKLAQVLDMLPDGCYTLTAGGAVKPNAMFTSVPKCARLLPEDHGDPLERLPFTFDSYKKDGAAMWAAPDGGLVLLDARFELPGCTLRRHHTGRNDKPVSVFRGDDFAGILMSIRPDDCRAELARVASVLGLAPASAA